MKRLRILLVGLVLIGILLGIWWRRSPLYHEVRTVATFTTIDAPADRVLKTLTDFDKYPEWNPYVVKVGSTEGKNLASQPKIRIEERAGKRSLSHNVRLTRFDQEGFAWQGSLFPGFLLNWREGFEVTPIDAAGVLRALPLQ